MTDKKAVTVREVIWVSGGRYSPVSMLRNADCEARVLMADKHFPAGTDLGTEERENDARRKGRNGT